MSTRLLCELKETLQEIESREARVAHAREGSTFRSGELVPLLTQTLKLRRSQARIGSGPAQQLIWAVKQIGWAMGSGEAPLRITHSPGKDSICTEIPAPAVCDACVDRFGDRRGQMERLAFEILQTPSRFCKLLKYVKSHQNPASVFKILQTPA